MHQTRRRTSGPFPYSICWSLRTKDIWTGQEKLCGGSPLVSLDVGLNLQWDCEWEMGLVSQMKNLGTWAIGYSDHLCKAVSVGLYQMWLRWVHFINSGVIRLTRLLWKLIPFSTWLSEQPIICFLLHLRFQQVSDFLFLFHWIQATVESGISCCTVGNSACNQFQWPLQHLVNPELHHLILDASVCLEVWHFLCHTSACHPNLVHDGINSFLPCLFLRVRLTMQDFNQLMPHWWHNGNSCWTMHGNCHQIPFLPCCPPPFHEYNCSSHQLQFQMKILPAEGCLMVGSAERFGIGFPASVYSHKLCDIYHNCCKSPQHQIVSSEECVVQCLNKWSNCSPELVCWDVEHKWTKYWCLSFSWGTFRFCVQRLIWGLYCLLWLPDASSAHGMTRRLNKGFPPAAFWLGLSDEPEV